MIKLTRPRTLLAFLLLCLSPSLSLSLICNVCFPDGGGCCLAILDGYPFILFIRTLLFIKCIPNYWLLIRLPSTVCVLPKLSIFFSLSSRALGIWRAHLLFFSFLFFLFFLLIYISRWVFKNWRSCFNLRPNSCPVLADAIPGISSRLFVPTGKSLFLSYTSELMVLIAKSYQNPRNREDPNQF